MLITWGNRNFIHRQRLSQLLLFSASVNELTKTMILFSLLCVKD